MAARLVHELSQPLTSVFGNVDVVRHALLSPDANVDELREIIEDVCADAERANELIRRYRDFLTEHDDAREIVSMSELLQDVVSFTRSEFGTRRIQLVVDCAPTLPTLLADRVQLEQVFVNLLLDGADALMHRPPGERHMAVRVRFLEPLIEVDIQDNGKGVDDRQLPRVFDSTVSTRAAGTGLCLRICGDIIKAHRGQISAESNPEGGARFRVLLPAHSGETEAGNSAPSGSGGLHQSISYRGVPHEGNRALDDARTDLHARRLSDLSLLQVESALTSIEAAEILLDSAIAAENIGLSLAAVRTAHRCILRLGGYLDAAAPNAAVPQSTLA